MTPFINDAGHVAFRSQPGRRRRNGREQPRGTSPARSPRPPWSPARKPPPRRPPGVNYSTVDGYYWNDFGITALSDGGQLAFSAVLGGEGVTPATRETGLFAGPISAPGVGRRNGQQALAAALCVRYAGLQHRQLAFNHVGQTAFVVGVTGPTVGPHYNALFVGPLTSPAMAAVSGERPRHAGGHHLRGLQFSQAQRRGQIAFEGYLDGEGVSVRQSPGPLRGIARVPDTGCPHRPARVPWHVTGHYLREFRRVPPRRGGRAGVSCRPRGPRRDRRTMRRLFAGPPGKPLSWSLPENTATAIKPTFNNRGHVLSYSLDDQNRLDGFLRRATLRPLGRGRARVTGDPHPSYAAGFSSLIPSSAPGANRHPTSMTRWGRWRSPRTWPGPQGTARSRRVPVRPASGNATDCPLRRVVRHREWGTASSRGLGRNETQ